MSKNQFYDCEKCLIRPFCKHITGEVEPSSEYFCFTYDRWKALYLTSNIPEKYSLLTIKDFNASEKLTDFVKEVIDNIDEYFYQNPKNIIFYSDTVGTGKTYTSVTILNHYIMNTMKRIGNKCFNPDVVPALFMDFAWYVDKIRHKFDVDYYDETIENMFDTKLLLLDDVGAGKMSDYAREQVSILINHRYNKKLPTIVTSNFSLDELASRAMLGERPITRLRENAYVVEMTNNNRRIAESYLHV